LPASLSDNPFAALGAMLVPALTDRMIDSIVTPDGVAAMIKQGRVKQPGRQRSPGGGSGEAENDVKVSYSYRGLNRFRVTLARKSEPDKSNAKGSASGSRSTWAPVPA
jgi:hypothetical protein